MKKLAFLLLLFSLLLLLMACAGQTPTTTEAFSSEPPMTTTLPQAAITTPAATTPAVTTPPITTTLPPMTEPTTTPPTTQPPKPKEKPIDILWGAKENCFVDDSYYGSGFMFRNDLEVFDNRWALTMVMRECESKIYELLVLTTSQEGYSTEWEMNRDYKWVLTIDGEKIEIENFDVLNNLTNGYVTLDLGSWQYPADEGHKFDIRLDIYDAYTGDALYYAWFTDPYWAGKGQTVPPSLP